MLLPRVLVALLLAACLGRSASAPPNIVFILLDDLRWDALSCTGHPFVKTPNIDRLAAEGATFRNAFVTTPLCFPSRASFLTGQYAHTHGIRYETERVGRGHELATFPLQLQRAGYETAFIGKWHLGDDLTPAPGIDRWVSFREQGQYVDPELYIDGGAVKMKGYLTDLLTDEAVAFIQRPRTQPFLIYLAHKAVHAPFIPAPRHRLLFAETPIVRALSAVDDWAGKPVLRRPGVILKAGDSDVETTDENIRDQLRCLLAVDEGVKRILDALTATGELDRTIIVFTSDHGYFWGEHGLGGKHGPYEEALRIPLLMRYPPLIKGGTVLDQMVLSIDIAPTLLELAQAPPAAAVEGRSLLPLLAGQTANWRTSFLAEFFLGGGTPRFPTWQAVRSERWKYIRYPEWAGLEELYDLAADPREMRNLVADPQAHEQQLILQAELDRLLKSHAP